MKCDIKSSWIHDLYNCRLRTVQSLSYHHYIKGYMEIHKHLKLNIYSYTCTIVVNNRFEIYL